MKKIGGLSIMKQALSIVLLLSGLFLYGCGSQGGATASSEGNDSTSIPGGGSQSGFTLNLVDSVDSVKAARVTTFDASKQPTANHVRVVIRRYDTVTTNQEVCDWDENDQLIPGSCHNVQVTSYTEIYKDIQDVSYSGEGSVTIGIPEGLGYTLDVITSELSGTAHGILKYGQATGVNVAPGAGATITMKTISQVLNMTVADNVVSKGKFDVTLNNVAPFAPSYKMTMSFDNQTPVVKNTSTNTCTFTAPESFTAGTVSLQGAFTIDRSLLMQNEPPANWTRLYPNAAYGEEVYSNLSPLIAVTVPL